MKQNKKTKSKWKPLDLIILAVAGCVLAVSAVKLCGIFMEYKAGTDEYKEIASQYAAHDTNKEAAEAKEEKDVKEPIDEAGYFPQVRVDFETLRSINEEFTGWLYIPALEVEYPVVQGSDNEYYLNHTFENKVNKSGAIFMDSEAAPGLTDYNTFIYGHNMKNRSMFGKLKLFGQDKELCESNPYFYIYTEEKNYKYLIISYYVTMEGSGTYLRPGTEEELAKYTKQILRSTPYKCSREIPEGASLVTLSTCYGNAGSDQRFVVHGALVQTAAAGADSTEMLE